MTSGCPAARGGRCGGGREPEPPVAQEGAELSVYRGKPPSWLVHGMVRRYETGVSSLHPLLIHSGEYAVEIQPLCTQMSAVT